MDEGSRFLLVTWDGAGNLPPERSLIRALIARGHSVDVLAHPSVRERFELDGATFHDLESPPPHSALQAVDPATEMQQTIDSLFFAPGFATDMAPAINACRPDVLLIDAALTYGLLEARASGLPTVALWHSLYGLLLGGPFAGLFNSRLDEINRLPLRRDSSPSPPIGRSSSRRKESSSSPTKTSTRKLSCPRTCCMSVRCARAIRRPPRVGDPATPTLRWWWLG